MDLYFLIYSSVPTKSLNESDLNELISVSRKENKANAITGVLLCLPGMYRQLIEGPKDKVEQLYLNIQKDKRHIKTDILQEGHLKNRFFPDWSMAYDSDQPVIKADGVIDFTAPASLKLIEILQG